MFFVISPKAMESLFDQYQRKLEAGQVYAIRLKNDRFPESEESFADIVEVSRSLPISRENKSGIITFPGPDDERLTRITAFRRLRDNAECWLTCSEQVAVTVAQHLANFRGELLKSLFRDHSELTLDHPLVNKALDWLEESILPQKMNVTLIRHDIHPDSDHETDEA